MKKGKSSPERLLKEISKLDDPVQFIGVCKILGIDVYKKNEEDSDEGACAMEPKNFYELWNEVCDIVEHMNRTRRRNLGKLIYSATNEKDEEGDS